MLTSGNMTVKKKTQSSEPEKELGQDMGGETESKPHKQQWQRPTSLGKILDSTLLGPYLFPWHLSIHWKLGHPFQSDLVDVLEDVARRDEKGNFMNLGPSPHSLWEINPRSYLNSLPP